VAGLLSLSMNAQTVAVSGTVSNKDGKPLSGVSVFVKGTSVGAVSDDEGKYSVTISDAGAVLVYSYVGYIVREVVTGSRTLIDVVLKEEMQSLNEAIVVGYGVQRRATVTGAIAFTTAEDISRSVATTTSGALVGKLAGVNSRMADGRPGASTSISIRNMGAPLYVIDGIQKDEGQFNNIDFNDIESISILKDASASIYGVRAANGVVVVSTKKGKRESGTNVNLNTYYGWQSLFKFPRPADAPTYIRNYMQSDAIKGVTNPRYTMEDLKKWEQGVEKGYRPFDWYEYIINTAPQWYVSANAYGGSQNINYYFAVSRIEQSDVMLNYGGFSRTNVQMNIESTVAKKLKIGAGLNGRIEKREQPGVPGGDDIWQGLFAVYRNLPTARPFANDNPDYPAQTSGNTEVNFGMLNYDLSGRCTNTWRVGQLNFNLEYDIVAGLKAKALFGYYLAQRLMDNQEYTYKLYRYDEASDTYPVVFSMDNPWRERDVRMVEETTAQFQLTYDKQFGLHNLNAVLAAESLARDTPGFWLHDRPASNSLSLIYFQTLMEFRDDGLRTEARLGYAGRINYDYDQRYLLELQARYDGSWKFPPNHRWGFFPSALVGWRISSEKFWENSNLGKIVNDFKLRVSYGIVGDDNVSGYSAFDYMPGYNYNSGGSTIDGAYVTGTQPRGLPVTTLSWLEAKIFNTGFDFGLFNGRLTGSVDYFYRLLGGLPAARYDVLIPNEVGFGLPSENLESNVHTGFDGMLTWKDKIGDVHYTLGGNWTFARQLDWYRYKPRHGNSWDYYRNSLTERIAYLNWGLHAIGQFQSWEEIATYDVDNDRQGNRTLRPGDIKYEDVNGDKRIDGLDERPLAYREGGLPYLNFAVTLGAEWKNIDFAVDFTGAAFASYTPDWEARNPFHDGGNQPQYYFDNQWRLSDPTDANSTLIPNKYPTIIEGNGGHSNYWKSDFWTINVSYIKLRNLELGYTFPQKWISKIGIYKLRIYTQMQNLFSIDNLGDLELDPEVTSGSGVQYSTNRIINTGISITF
jgi:TonB-linked SusC/RagA family outer membrane protein